MIILNKEINFKHIKHNLEDLEKTIFSKSLEDTKFIGRNISINYKPKTKSNLIYNL